MDRRISATWIGSASMEFKWANVSQSNTKLHNVVGLVGNSVSIISENRQLSYDNLNKSSYITYCRCNRKKSIYLSITSWSHHTLHTQYYLWPCLPIFITRGSNNMWPNWVTHLLFEGYTGEIWNQQEWCSKLWALCVQMCWTSWKRHSQIRFTIATDSQYQWESNACWREVCKDW